MNTNFNKEIVQNTIDNYINQIEKMNDINKTNYYKVYKSLKDTVILLKSLNDMNIEETNEYFRLLMAAISASIIIN